MPTTLNIRVVSQTELVERMLEGVDAMEFPSRYISQLHFVLKREHVIVTDPVCIELIMRNPLPGTSSLQVMPNHRVILRDARALCVKILAAVEGHL